MKNIKIIATGKYLPQNKVTNKELEEKLNLEENFIEKRTGIKERYYAKEETIESLAINSTKNLFEKKQNSKELMENIDLIIVATTTPMTYMPGISNYIQKEFSIKDANCIDILAGCNGYIAAFDIASTYILAGKVKKALIIGVDKLSSYTDETDINTSIILSDGAGATLIEGEELNSENNQNNLNANIQSNIKSNIKSDSTNCESLKCEKENKIYMNGKEIYKYAVTETVKNIEELLQNANEKIENIKYILPHQSNKKIIKSIANRLKVQEQKMYINIENVGNTFCASIPIALDELIEENKINKGDKIILLGYGGGLNTGSILLQM